MKSQVIVLLDEQTKIKFKSICAKEQTTMSNVIKDGVDEYIKDKTKKVIY